MPELFNTHLIRDPNLLEYHRYETGKTLIDSSGRGNDFTAETNVLGPVVGVFGGAMSYGTANNAYSTHTRNLGIANVLSMGCWFKPNEQPSSTEGGIMMLCEDTGTTNNSTYDISYWNDGGTYKMAFRRWYNIAGIFATRTLATGTWHHAVLTHTAGGTVSAYLDGQALGSYATVYSASGNTKVFYTSYTGYGYGAYTIDDAFLFNRVLSATEINYLYSGVDPGRAHVA